MSKTLRRTLIRIRCFSETADDHRVPDKPPCKRMVAGSIPAPGSEFGHLEATSPADPALGAKLGAKLLKHRRIPIQALNRAFSRFVRGGWKVALGRFVEVLVGTEPAEDRAALDALSRLQRNSRSHETGVCGPMTLRHPEGLSASRLLMQSF